MDWEEERIPKDGRWEEFLIKSPTEGGTEIWGTIIWKREDAPVSPRQEKKVV